MFFTFENIFGMIWVQKWGPPNGTFRNHDQPIDSEDSEVPCSRTPTSGWWFGTCFIFRIYWECHHPNWRTPSFFRGVGLNHQAATCFWVWNHQAHDATLLLFPVVSHPQILRLCQVRSGAGAEVAAPWTNGIHGDGHSWHSELENPPFPEVNPLSMGHLYHSKLLVYWSVYVYILLLPYTWNMKKDLPWF